MFRNKPGRSLIVRYFWKVLVNTWGLLAMIIFTLEFLAPQHYDSATSYIAVIYPAVLTIYAGQKEVSRWSDKKFRSLFSGEVFVILWTALFLLFAFIGFLSRGLWILSIEMTTTYLAVISIFAISWQSKNYRDRK